MEEAENYEDALNEIRYLKTEGIISGATGAKATAAG